MKNKVEMPLLSNEQLNEIDEVINEKLNKGMSVEVDFWKDGYIKTINGYIKKMDILEGTMSLSFLYCSNFLY